MTLRLCSRFLLPPLLLRPLRLHPLRLRPLRLLGAVALLAVIAASGCYPHQGKPVGATPDQLLVLAHDACHRHDSEAWQMLLGRLAERHPETPQGVHARRLLDEQSGSLASCQRTLQADQTHD